MIYSFNKIESSKMKRPSLISINSNISSEFLSKILLENPYLINSKDDYGNTFLSYAIKRNNQEIIDLIMALPFLDLNYKDNNDNTYLHFAVICKNIELIKQLIKKGISINSKNKDGNTPLHFSYYINSKDIINLLIKNNCDINIKNNKGLLPKEIEPIDDLFKIIENETTANKFEDNGEDELKFDKKYQTVELSQINRIIRSKDDNNDILNNSKKIKKILGKKSINEKIRNSKYDIRKKSSLYYNTNTEKGFRKISSIAYNFNESDKFIRKESENYQFYLDLISPTRNIYNPNSPKSNNTITSEGNSEKNNNDLENNNIEKNNTDDSRQEKIKSFRKINAMNLFQKKVVNTTNKMLLDFLLQINLEKYYEQINKSEFSDIFKIIEENKNGHYITDYQLQNIGINKPGDRAKILIRIQEKSNLFDFIIPKAVYYSTNNYNEQIEKDENLNKLLLWLKEINLDIYFLNFVNNGYFSVDLLFVQMESKNPLNEEILKNEILIEKLGYRMRILNKLKEEYPMYLNNLKNENIVYNRNENNRLCSSCTAF